MIMLILTNRNPLTSLILDICQTPLVLSKVEMRF